jgi:hypothetical protein
MVGGSIEMPPAHVLAKLTAAISTKGVAMSYRDSGLQNTCALMRREQAD